MTVNVYKGARRVTLVVQLLWVAGVATATWTFWLLPAYLTVSEGVRLAVGGWLVLAVIQGGLGWIVRGFLDIPWRHDRRPRTP